MKKFIPILVLGIAMTISALAGGFAYAAFLDKIEFNDAMISTGSADLRLVDNLMLGPIEGNIVDTLPAPVLENLTPASSFDYPFMLYNSGSMTLRIKSTASYATANDPSELRKYVMVEFFDWSDTNGSGNVDPGELGVSYGNKNIIDWKNEGFEFGDLDAGTVKPLVIRFTAPGLPSDRQNKSGSYDFSFSAEGL